MLERPVSALPLTESVLRILIGLNWLFGAAILALLAASFNEAFFIRAMKIPATPDGATLLVGMKIIAVLGLAAIPVNNALLRRLLGIAETMRDGDPFVGANAVRLRAIAWLLLSLQLVSIAVAAVAAMVSTPQMPLHLDAGVSVGGWLSVLFAFVLAQIFETGTEMRDDLEETV